MFLFLILIINIFSIQNAFAEVESSSYQENKYQNILTFSSSVYDFNTKIFYGKNLIGFYDGEFLKSDEAYYNNRSIYATGNVSIVIDPKGELLDCDKLYWDTNKKKLLMSNLAIYDKKKDFLFASKFAEKNDKIYTLYNAAYTTCRCSGNDPMWQIKARKVILNEDKNEVRYYGAGIWFFGKFQIVHTPYFSHPTPSSPPKTGFLSPGLHDSLIATPFYYRPKSNIDFVLTPKIKINDIFIQEVEMRHLVSNGYYASKFAISNLDRFFLNQEDGENIKNKKINKYLFESKGDFTSSSVGNYYGFNVNLASDQGFIKRYYKIYKNALKSEGYVFNNNSSDYVKAKVIYFHALPGVPKLYSSTIFVTNSSNKYYSENGYVISYNNQNTFYHDEENDIYGRDSIIRLSNNFIISKTFLDGDVDVRGNFISDLYKLKNSSCFGKIKPEFQMDLKRAFQINNNFVSEPIVKLSVSKPRKNNLKKYSLIDARYEYKNFISLMNQSDYYTGSDIYSSGLEFNYGIRNYVNSNNSRFSLFVGGSKFFFKDINQNDIVTLLFNMYLSSVNLQYELNKSIDKKDKNFYLSKIGLSYNKKNKFSTSIFLIDAKIDKQKFNYKLANNCYKTMDYLLTRQMSIDSSYDINQNWVVGSGLRFDLLKSRFDFIYRSLKISFHNECFELFGKISNDNFKDKTVNLKKSTTYSIGFKLKTLG